MTPDDDAEIAAAMDDFEMIHRLADAWDVPAWDAAWWLDEQGWIGNGPDG